MQTWIPDTDPAECARVLDTRRLGAQRGEGRAALLCLVRQARGEPCGWANHPVPRMWRGHEQALAAYLVHVCWEWAVRRGHRDATLARVLDDCASVDVWPCWEPPPWWGGPVHASHRARLLWTLPEHYTRFWPGQPVPEDWQPYDWPVEKEAAPWTAPQRRP